MPTGVPRSRRLGKDVILEWLEELTGDAKAQCGRLSGREGEEQRERFGEMSEALRMIVVELASVDPIYVEKVRVRATRRMRRIETEG